MKWSGSIKFLVALVAAAGLAAPLEAQAPAKPIGHSAQVSSAVKVDVSPALRTIPPIHLFEGLKAPQNPPLNKQNRIKAPVEQPAGVDTVLQRTPGSTNMPAPLLSFEGANDVWSLWPPDTQGDVGPNHYIQWVNLGFAIYDKAGTKVYPASGFANGNTLWTGFGGACETSNDGDPQTNYDHLADRWVMSQFALPNYPSGPFYQCFAVSTTPDPLGTWYRYAFVVSATAMNDYPKIGVWPDGYYMTVNQFYGGSGLGAFVYERDKMLAGTAAQQIYFNVGTPYGGALPADLDGIAPPPGTPGYVAEWDDTTWGMGDAADTMRVWEVHVDWTNPANSTFGLNAAFDPNFKIVTADALPLCVGNRACIPQPGTSAKLDAIADRAMQRLQYRFVNGVPRLTVNHTVDAGGGRAGVRWYQLSDPGTGWAMLDQGTFAGASGDTDNRWMGSAALDIQGNMAIGYSVSSATTYPSVRYNGRLAGDPAGTLGVEGSIVIGGGSQLDTSYSRWGDYSSISVDPTDECTFWYTQEYYATSSSAGWQTRIGAFKFPGCVAGPSGVIEGYVKSTAGGDPLAGALVQVGPSITTTTNAAGFYHLTVAVGTYDVTASKFGYSAATATGQVVADGVTTTVPDLMLSPVGTYAVDGFVTAAEHNWPLWARIEVRQAGTLVDTVYTSPWNGYYLIAALPNGLSYEFTVHSMMQGYQDEVRTVTLASGDQVQSFALLAASGNPAYACVLQGGINENFDGAFPPLGWTVKNNGSDPNMVWKRNDAWGRSNLTGGSGTAAAADSDKAGSGSAAFNTELWSPSILMPATPRNLKFRSAYYSYGGQTGTLDVSTNGGTSWTNLLTITVSAVAERTVDMTAYAGQTIVLRWKFVSPSWAYYWQIDDVRTETIPVTPPPAMSEAFEGTVPPTGWSQVSAGTTIWKSNVAWGRANLTGGTGNAAGCDVDINGSAAYDCSLITSAFDVSSLPAPNLSIKIAYNDISTTANRDFFDIDASSDGGTTWTNVSHYAADFVGTANFDLTGKVTGANNKLRFRYYTADGLSHWDWYAYIDDLAITGPPPPVTVDNPTLLCAPVAGTMVAGFVTDANTTTGITGAKVVSDLGGLAMTAAATGNLPAGFYYMFSPTPVVAPNGPSTRTFTASKTGYGTVAQSVNLIPDTMNRLDFALPAGALELADWPFRVDGRMTPDSMPASEKTQDFSILNTGGLAANVKLGVMDLGMQFTHLWPGLVQPAAPTAPKTPSIGHAKKPPVASAEKRYPGLAHALATIPAFGIELTGSTSGNLRTWPDASIPAAWSLIAPSASYYAGGFVGGDFSKLYAINSATNTLTTIDTTTGAITGIGVATPNSGESWTGLKGSSNGNVYATGTNCSSSTLYTIDVATGHATAVGPITGGGCIISLAINNAGEIYAIDIVSDNLLKVDPATGAGTVVGSLGASANYAQGMDFEKDSGTLYWAAYTSGGELRTIDTTTGASTLIGPFPGGAEVDAYAIASGGASGVPWLTLTPTEGTVPAMSQLDIHAEFFLEGVNPAHFGLFRGVIKTTNDTSNALPDIPAYLTKAFWDVPRGYWADAQIHALAGARVTRGCGSGNFCPENTLTRAEMAVTMVRAMYGPDYAPPPAIGIFADVVISDTDTTADYIEQLYNDGVVNGCAADPLRYCPNDILNRAQMAKFIAIAFKLPLLPPTGYFTDVSGTVWDWAAPYAEALRIAGITLGCGDHLYCPANNITRAELAVMLVRGLGLPTYTHPPLK